LPKNALFLNRIFKKFLGRGLRPTPSPNPTLYPSAPYAEFLDPPLCALVSPLPLACLFSVYARTVRDKLRDTCHCDEYLTRSGKECKECELVNARPNNSTIQLEKVCRPTVCAYIFIGPLMCCKIYILKTEKFRAIFFTYISDLRLQSFVQLSIILTKLCHIMCDYPDNFKHFFRKIEQLPNSNLSIAEVQRVQRTTMKALTTVKRSTSCSGI